MLMLLLLGFQVLAHRLNKINKKEHGKIRVLFFFNNINRMLPQAASALRKARSHQHKAQDLDFCKAYAFLF